MDTVEYEDGKAFVVSSFVSEDAAESGGSASLILKKMAVLNPCIDDGTRVKCAACTASPIREVAVNHWRWHGLCAAGLHEQSAADPPGRCDCRQISDQQCLCDTRTLVHRVFAPSLGRSTNIYRTDSLASCPDVRSVSSRALMSNGSASGTESF